MPALLWLRCGDEEPLTHERPVAPSSWVPGTTAPTGDRSAALCFLPRGARGDRLPPASDVRELRDAVAYAFQFDNKVVVEEAIVGRELECGVLGGDAPQASVVGEIVVTSTDGFYSYDAKYLDPNGARLELPARIDRKTATRVQRLAVRTFEVLECHGLARVDFF